MNTYFVRIDGYDEVIEMAAISVKDACERYVEEYCDGQEPNADLIIVEAGKTHRAHVSIYQPDPVVEITVT